LIGKLGHHLSMDLKRWIYLIDISSLFGDALSISQRGNDRLLELIGNTRHRSGLPGKKGTYNSINIKALECFQSLLCRIGFGARILKEKVYLRLMVGIKLLSGEHSSLI